MISIARNYPHEACLSLCAKNINKNWNILYYNKQLVSVSVYKQHVEWIESSECKDVYYYKKMQWQVITIIIEWNSYTADSVGSC